MVDSSGFTLAGPDKLVLVGTFDNLSFTLDPSLSLEANFEAVSLAGGWKQFGLDTATLAPNAGVTSTLGLSATGKIGGSVTDNTFGSTKADAFNDKAIYVWVFNRFQHRNIHSGGTVQRDTAATVAWTSPVNAGGVADSALSAPGFGRLCHSGRGRDSVSTTGSQLQLTNSFAAVPEPLPHGQPPCSGFLVLGMRAIRQEPLEELPRSDRRPCGPGEADKPTRRGTSSYWSRTTSVRSSSSLTNSVGPGVRLAETPVIDSLAQNGVVLYPRLRPPELLRDARHPAHGSACVSHRSRHGHHRYASRVEGMMNTRLPAPSPHGLRNITSRASANGTSVTEPTRPSRRAAGSSTPV